MYRLVLSLAFLAIASCKDIEQGQNSTEAHKIFDEKREASPAVWRQIEKVTVNTTDEEVISRVVITDLRPDKDGDASIVEGGEGNQNVTIELKSPTVLRGYEFHIEVYAVPKGQHEGGFNPAIVGNDQSKILNGNVNPRGDILPTQFGSASSSPKPPVPLATDVKINDHQNPVDVTKGADDNISSQKNSDVSTQMPGLKTNDHSRHARDNAQVTQSTTEGPRPSTVHSTKDSKDANDQGVHYPQLHVDKTTGITEKLIPGILNNNDTTPEKVHSTAIPTTATTGKYHKTDAPRVNRGTDVTSPKPANEPSDNIHKIPASGHVTIPKEFKDIQDSKPSQDGKNPAPYVPKLNFPLQPVQTTLGEMNSTLIKTSSVSDEEESSEEDKRSDTTHTMFNAQKPKSN